jgi:hypothetical protein
LIVVVIFHCEQSMHSDAKLRASDVLQYSSTLRARRAGRGGARARAESVSSGRGAHVVVVVVVVVVGVINVVIIGVIDVVIYDHSQRLRVV